MMDFTGLKCPVCGKEFKKGDDIVVCPKCGAPYHRECFIEHGDCVFTDQHGRNFAWKPPVEAAPESPGEQAPKRRCPRCGFPNSDTALFCEHCGLPLSDFVPPVETAGPAGPQGAQPSSQPRYIPQPGVGIPLGFDPLGGIKPDETFDGKIPAGEMARFVQTNTQYYIPVFSHIEKYNRTRFNFSAFLFPGAWMLYRKIYKAGSWFVGVMGILFGFYLYIQKFLWYPLYSDLLGQIGLSPDNLSAITAKQSDAFIQLVLNLSPHQLLIFFLPTLLSMAELVIMVIAGAIGNRMYYRYCLDSMGQIRRQTHDRPADSAEAIAQRGGVNLTVAMIFSVVYLFVLYSI